MLGLGLSGRASLGSGRKEWSGGTSLSLSGRVVPGARCKESGVLHTKQSTKHQAPSNPAPLRSGHGLLIFDCVHGPFSFGPHRPLADAYWSRTPRSGDTPALEYPTVYQLAGALGPIGNGGCDIHSPLCSCLHWLSLCLLLASSLPAVYCTVCWELLCSLAVGYPWYY